MKSAVAVWALVFASIAHGADLRVGVGRAVITPDTQPVWLSGYAGRTVPSTGMIHHVWAKALALEDSGGSRAVIITADVLGLTREITSTVAARLAAKSSLCCRAWWPMGSTMSMYRSGSSERKYQKD